jgi:hypothetical protein
MRILVLAARRAPPARVCLSCVVRIRIRRTDVPAATAAFGTEPAESHDTGLDAVACTFVFRDVHADHLFSSGPDLLPAGPVSRNAACLAGYQPVQLNSCFLQRYRWPPPDAIPLLMTWNAEWHLGQNIPASCSRYLT